MSRTTPSDRLVLSPFDRAIGAIYIRKLYGFRFADPALPAEACDALRRGLSASMTQYPFAAASIELVAGQGPVALPHQDPAATELCPPLFVVKNIAEAGFPCTYQQLCEQGVPPSVLQKEIFSCLPEHPKPGEVCPALGVQTNLLDGGLIVCFAFHHTVFDGASATNLLRALGANISARRTRENCVVQPAVLERLPYPERTAPPPDLSKFPEYDFSNAPLLKASSTSATSRILTFTADKLATLRSEVVGLLQGTAGPDDFVSTADCLGGLIWVAVMRARQAHVVPHQLTKWAIAVNARRRLEPPLPAEYFGNAVVHSVAISELGQLVAADESDINIARITCAASRIRQAVDAADDAYVRRRLDLFSFVPDPADIPIASKRALDMPNTGLDFSDWREQGADFGLGIPGTGSTKPDWVRKTWSANEGAVNILPRKGGRKGSADWKVLLALSVEDMEK
ncbi:hypothetical protein B0A55_01977 [Friedmanniomyces simplex]|uniref:Uncharacterized protein n=1 Tax=Friedmanniomyces simplex TaxID=329884 RepID=A0A4U0XSA3_9PEZI|nr:hypothetical protein B0A55_01977 [Friedmanniomyces simplex]